MLEKLFNGCCSVCIECPYKKYCPHSGVLDSLSKEDEYSLFENMFFEDSIISAIEQENIDWE